MAHGRACFMRRLLLFADRISRRTPSGCCIALCALLLFYMAVYPSFWAIPTTFLSETTAAAAFGLINSVGQTGASFGPSIVGYLNDTTHSIQASLIFVACSMFMSALIFFLSSVHCPDALCKN